MTPRTQKRKTKNFPGPDYFKEWQDQRRSERAFDRAMKGVISAK